MPELKPSLVDSCFAGRSGGVGERDMTTNRSPVAFVQRIRMTASACCLAMLCLGSAGCLMSRPYGGPATAEAYQWTGHNALFPGAGQPLSEQAARLAIQPSDQGDLSELDRTIVIPFFLQQKPDGYACEVLDPVVLTGGKKRFDYPSRSFRQVWIAPMCAIPMDPPPFPGAVIFAEGAWPVCATDNVYGLGRNVDTSSRPGSITIRTVHHPQRRKYDSSVGERAGLGGVGGTLTRMLDTHPDELFQRIDEAAALMPEDRLMIYRQLTRLAEDAVALNDPGAGRDAIRVIKTFLPKLQAKSR